MTLFPSHADGPRSGMNSVLNLRVVFPWFIIGYVQWFTGGDLARAEAFDLFPPENLDLILALSMTISAPMIVIGAFNLVEPPER
ncbi:hypothetical protein OG21DRAFT_1516545 [Imleria badia]|nr:hypothetical protein OG21DRAFT_1516545 [Imleria badia]